MSKDKTLIIITFAFPYGAGEAFLESEFPYLVNEFKRVIIFTTGVENGDGVTLDGSIEVRKFIRLKYSYIFSVLFSRDFWSDMYAYLFSKTSIKSFEGVRYIFSFFRNAWHKKKQIKNFLIQENLYNSEELIICSYWMTDDALTVALLKKEMTKITVATRAHGFDLYEERSPFKFLAAREIIKTNLNKLFFISDAGKSHFSKWHGNIDNAVVSRLGVKEKIFKGWEPSTVMNIVSCAYIQQVKRIDLLIKALALVNKNLKINWTHIGNAVNEQSWLETVQLAKEVLKVENITYNLIGYMSNSEVSEFYKNSEIDVLVSVSSSEGIPVTMMEAMSFGVPVISTNVGGVGEIVEDGHNGFLINANASALEIALKIEEFAGLDASTLKTLRANAYETWKQKFHSEKNSLLFIRNLID